jgi:hypothetical protein
VWDLRWPSDPVAGNGTIWVGRKERADVRTENGENTNPLSDIEFYWSPTTDLTITGSS